MDEQKPSPEHAWLQRFVGEWHFEVDVPDDPAANHSGTERIRSLGPFWVVSEGEWSSAQGSGSSLMTIGYDAENGRFTGTFVGSSMSWLWIYTSGSLDESREALTLGAEGPSYARPGETASYRDVFTFEGDDRRAQTSYYLDDGTGDWVPFLTVQFRRTA